MHHQSTQDDRLTGEMVLEGNLAGLKSSILLKTGTAMRPDQAAQCLGLEKPSQNGDGTTSLGNLLPCTTILPEKIIFPFFESEVYSFHFRFNITKLRRAFHSPLVSVLKS